MISQLLSKNTVLYLQNCHLVIQVLQNKMISSLHLFLTTVFIPSLSALASSFICLCPTSKVAAIITD